MVALNSHTNLKISAELKTRLELAAKENSISVSGLIRMACIEYLKSREGRKAA